MNTGSAVPTISGPPLAANNVYWRLGLPPSARDSARVAADVASRLPSEAPFSPTLVVVITWFAIAPYGGTTYLDTLQATLAVDAANRSFVTLCCECL